MTTECLINFLAQLILADSQRSLKTCSNAHCSSLIAYRISEAVAMNQQVVAIDATMRNSVIACCLQARALFIPNMHESSAFSRLSPSIHAQMPTSPLVSAPRILHFVCFAPHLAPSAVTGQRLINGKRLLSRIPHFGSGRSNLECHSCISYHLLWIMHGVC